MATSAARFCSGSPTCPYLAGQCAIHGTSAQRRDKARGSAHERGYDYAWAQYSALFRTKYPICGMRTDGNLHREHSQCIQQGRTSAAEVVDHITPMSKGGSKWEPTNHQSLCKRCNTAKGDKC
jgi:5-methylcytosine-specific restriction endonuclease McrA